MTAPRSSLFAGLLALSATAATPAFAAPPAWLPDSDPTARYIIDLERRWAEAGCTGEQFDKLLLAKGFIGTAPDGHLYDHTDDDATRKGADGKPELRCLAWTDTWVKEGDAWKIVAVQDGAVDCRQRGGQIADKPL